MGEQRPSSPPHCLRGTAIGLTALPDPPSRAPIGGHVGKVALLTPCPAPLKPALHFRLRIASPSVRFRPCSLLSQPSGFRLESVQQARLGSARLTATWHGPTGRAFPRAVRPSPPPDLGSPDSPPCERGLMAGAQRFRFREESGPGAHGAMLEVRVPQVRAVAPTWKRSLIAV